MRPEVRMFVSFNVSAATVQTIGGELSVTLHRSVTSPTLDQALWAAIRNRTHAISFHRYRHFLNRVLRWEEHEKLPEAIERRLRDLGAHRLGVTSVARAEDRDGNVSSDWSSACVSAREHSRELELDALGDSARLGAPVKAGELAERLSQYLGHPPQLPYITRVVETAFPEYLLHRQAGHRLLCDRINEPCLIELIWSYWHEEGMLMQTINAINQRFQNIRRPGDHDPLANMAIEPLRPLNNLLWGFAQDEVHRLTVARRAAEYCNLYGFEMRGRAVSGLQVADKRSKFLEAFHNLLYQSSVFFKEDFQTTIIADGYPLLNALKEVHLILAQGAQQSVRRPALDGTRRDASGAVHASAAGDARIPAEPRHGPLQGSVDAAGRRDEDTAGVDGCVGDALPRPRRLWRTAAALDPLWRLDRRRERGQCEELGALP